MKSPEHTYSLFRAIFWILASIALASTGTADDEVKRFDLLKMDHASTVCEKRGVIWGVCYGRTDKGQVAYAVFYDGSKPSPFAAKFWSRSSGERGVRLVAKHNGEGIDPPSPQENILVILDDKVMRGHFEPMEDAKFHEFLKQNEEFAVAGLEAFSMGDNGDRAPEKSK